MAKYILALDQGTTSTRAVLFDKDQRIVAFSQKEIPNYFPHEGWVEMDAQDIWHSTLAVINDVIINNDIDPNDVIAMGISNQRETTIVFDRVTKKPLYKAIVWQSRQTSAIIDRYKNEHDAMMIIDKTGLLLDPYFSASKMRFILEEVKGVKENPNAVFGTVDTWLAFRLSAGKAFKTDVTNASRTLLFNIHELKWDEDLLKLFEIESFRLPQVISNSEFVTYVDPKYFFGHKLPITALVGDQQAALFGQSCFEKGDIKNTYGTGGFILMNTGEKVITSKNGLISTIAWKIKDRLAYALEGSIFVSGSLMQWLRDDLKILDRVADSEKIAQSVQDDEKVIVIPAFTGLGAPYWRKDVRGAIFNLTRAVKREHIIKASLEAMAFLSYDLIMAMEKDSLLKIKELKVDGGASANDYLCQFQSSLLNIKVTRQKCKEATALGAARLAGLGAGFYYDADLREVDYDIFEPYDHTRAKELYELYLKALDKLLR